MRKPVTATTVLLLLVLVPSAVLAWLGYQSADAFDATEKARLRDDLETAGRQLAAVVPQITQGIEDELEQQVEAAAVTLTNRLPLLDAAQGARALREVIHARLPAAAVASVRIVDARGRSLLPREHAPNDAPDPDGEPTQAGLIESLRRQADQAYFGVGGLERSLAIWTTAQARFHSDALRLLADVERARLRAREDASGRVAAGEAGQLEERWEQRDLIAAGRATFLLWMAAAAADHHYAQRIREGYAEGWADAIPLTREERVRADLVAASSDSRYAVVADPRAEAAVRKSRLAAARNEAVVVLSAAMPQGARLVVRLRVEALLLRFTETLESTWSAPDLSASPFVLGRLRFGPELGARLEHGLPRYLSMRATLPGAAPGGVHIQHLGWERVRSDRASRRFGITVAVVCLFLVTALALFLIRRAIARERQARRMRDEFIANVTHEVRTPLTSVLLHSQMMADEQVADDKRKDHAEVVQAQGRRLAALIDDMLDFARLERGTRTLEAVPVDLSAACREAIAPYLVLAEQDGVEVTCDIESEEVAAMADPAALARILGNLVGNAWKHGRPARTGGPGRIRVLAREAGGDASVEVRDDGPGIPAEERARVFERFGRGRRSTRIEGSGIGLALSRDLAQALGGDLDVRDDGDETIFRLRLPAVPELEWEE